MTMRNTDTGLDSGEHRRKAVDYSALLMATDLISAEPLCFQPMRPKSGGAKVCASSKL